MNYYHEVFHSCYITVYLHVLTMLGWTFLLLIHLFHLIYLTTCIQDNFIAHTPKTVSHAFAHEKWILAWKRWSAAQTRNSPGDEIANVNFLYDDIVHALKYNRLLHKFRHRSFSKCSEITQCNGHYAVQGHSRSFKVTDFGTNRKLIYDFLYTNLPPILHRFQVMADYWSNFR